MKIFSFTAGWLKFLLANLKLENLVDSVDEYLSIARHHNHNLRPDLKHGNIREHQRESRDIDKVIFDTGGDWYCSRNSES